MTLDRGIALQNILRSLKAVDIRVSCKGQEDIVFEGVLLTRVDADYASYGLVWRVDFREHLVMERERIQYD